MYDSFQQKTVKLQETQDAKPLYQPTLAETVHMRPTNNFENITEEEFDRRERAKNEYRAELQKQMEEFNAKKENQKKKDVLIDIQQEQKIYRDLHSMRDEFIKEEAKKGNAPRGSRIDMLPPLTEDEALSLQDKKRDRSRSKSKSPNPRHFL